MKKIFLVVISLTGGFAVGAGIIGKMFFNQNEKIKELADKHFALYIMMNQWVKVKQQNKSVSDYLIKCGFKKVAIYGMGYAGDTLYEELKDTEVEVLYAIDKNADNIYSELDIVKPDEKLNPVDCVVVTSIFYFDEIKKNLKDKINAPIVSLEDILYEV